MLVKLVLITQRRVLCDMDTLLLMKLLEAWLLKPRMKFDLVNSGNDCGFFQQTLQFSSGKVGYANCLDLPGLEKFLHRLVCLEPD